MLGRKIIWCRKYDKNGSSIISPNKIILKKLGKDKKTNDYFLW